MGEEFESRDEDVRIMFCTNEQDHCCCCCCVDMYSTYLYLATYSKLYYSAKRHWIYISSFFSAATASAIPQLRGAIYTIYGLSWPESFILLLLVQPTTTSLKELSKSPKNPAHITHIEFSFHLSLLNWVFWNPLVRACMVMVQPFWLICFIVCLVQPTTTSLSSQPWKSCPNKKTAHITAHRIQLLFEPTRTWVFWHPLVRAW